MFTRSIYKIRAQVKKKRITVNRRGQPVGRAAAIVPSSVAITAPFHRKGHQYLDQTFLVPHSSVFLFPLLWTLFSLLCLPQ
jgi:hypothetical protein